MRRRFARTRVPRGRAGCPHSHGRARRRTQRGRRRGVSRRELDAVELTKRLEFDHLTDGTHLLDGAQCRVAPGTDRHDQGPGRRQGRKCLDGVGVTPLQVVEQQHGITQTRRARPPLRRPRHREPRVVRRCEPAADRSGPGGSRGPHPRHNRRPVTATARVARLVLPIPAGPTSATARPDSIALRTWPSTASRPTIPASTGRRALAVSVLSPLVATDIHRLRRRQGSGFSAAMSRVSDLERASSPTRVDRGSGSRFSRPEWRGTAETGILKLRQVVGWLLQPVARRSWLCEGSVAVVGSDQQVGHRPGSHTMGRAVGGAARPSCGHAGEGLPAEVPPSKGGLSSGWVTTDTPAGRPSSIAAGTDPGDAPAPCQRQADDRELTDPSRDGVALSQRHRCPGTPSSRSRLERASKLPVLVDDGGESGGRGLQHPSSGFRWRGVVDDATCWVCTWVSQYDEPFVGLSTTWPPCSTPSRARLVKNTSHEITTAKVPASVCTTAGAVPSMASRSGSPASDPGEAFDETAQRHVLAERYASHLLEAVDLLTVGPEDHCCVVEVLRTRILGHADDQRRVESLGEQLQLAQLSAGGQLVDRDDVLRPEHEVGARLAPARWPRGDAGTPRARRCLRLGCVAAHRLAPTHR